MPIQFPGRVEFYPRSAMSSPFSRDRTLEAMGGPSPQDLSDSMTEAERGLMGMTVQFEEDAEEDDEQGASFKSADDGRRSLNRVLTRSHSGRYESTSAGDVDEREKIDDDLLGDLGLSDFMLLAYTISNIYQRHKVRSRAAKLDDSQVVGHDETLLFVAIALYACAVLVLALNLMGGAIACRPTSVTLGAFASGSGGVSPGGHFEYGMDLVNRVCETQIKLETSQFWPVFTMVTFVLLFAGAGINAQFIKRYNRLHAIARGQYHSPLVGKDPVRKSEKVEGKFERFYLLFMIVKFIGIIIAGVMLAGFWYSILTFASISSETVNGVTTYSGGNLLTRHGAICDASKLDFEEAFDAQYRCHLKGEAQMHYLKYFVVMASVLVIVISVYQSVLMILMHKSYEAWKRQFDELQAKKKEQDLPPESDLNPEQISMFKMTRGLVRLFMYYMKPSPPDGDLPSLIAKAMFGISPDEGELANISTKMLTEFASPQETSDMLMHVLRGALGDHIGESEDVRKIVLATVTAWKDSSTQRYLKGIVDTINAIHRDERDRVVGDGRAAAMMQSPSRRHGGGGPVQRRNPTPQTPR